MNIRKFLNWGWNNWSWKKKETEIPVEETYVKTEMIEDSFENKSEEIEKCIQTEETITEENTTEKIPHATGNEECFDAIHKLFEEATINAMLNMAMWMRLNYFANTIGQTDGKDINWNKINKFLMLGIDKKKPYYNIYGRIKNVEQLKRAAVDARLAAIPDFGMPFYRRKCKQCGEMFELTLGEIESYEKKGLYIPCRCWHCRKGINKHTGENIVLKQIEEEPMKTEMQIALEKAGIVKTERS